VSTGYLYLDDAFGKEYAEINTTQSSVDYNNFWLGGRIVAKYDPTYGTVFLHPSSIGSTAMTTGPTNSAIGAEIFYPWGQSWASAGTLEEERFAKLHQRDIGTGLDYTLNRMYPSWQGRWLTPDPGGRNVVNLGDPQSWNMYAYVRNNPTTLTDPTGLDALWITDERTGQTTLVIPVRFRGAAATPENVSAIVNRDNTLNIGDSPVKVQVIATDKKIDGVLNHMDLSPGENSKFGSAGEGTKGLGGKKAHIDSDAPEATGAAAHDVLHFAGIKDEYVEGKPDAQGNRTSTPAPGYDNSNIMTSRAGTNLKPEQIQEANTNRSTRHCTVGQDGKTVCN